MEQGSPLMYGENTGELRDALGSLLREHRIQQRLGGRGVHSVPETTTASERETLGQQIQRYRESVLTWCLQGVRATTPHTNFEDTSSRSRGPSEELLYRLTEAHTASASSLAPVDELIATQRFPTIESWRMAARAATLGEHDFAAGVRYGQLSEDQCLTVLKDVADVVRGLVVLDRRYEGVPGWQKLKEQGRLGRAAAACAAHAGYGDPDYTVDLQGWKPAPQLLDGPSRPGMYGVLQAEHNLLMCLHDFPDAHSLRVIIASQHLLAHEASQLIAGIEPDLATRWVRRAETYHKLVKETRDLGGLIGEGRAAGHGAVAATRMRNLGAALPPIEEWHQLDRLFGRIDLRVRTTIEHGVKRRLYFQRVPLPRVDDQGTGLVKTQRYRFAPITPTRHSELLRLVRHQLRPEPIRRRPPAGAAQSRVDFEAAISHRPGESGPALSM